MSDETTNPTPALAPAEAPATPAVAETPVQPETPSAAPAPATPPAGGERPKIVKKFFKERPRDDRPKLDLTEITTGVKLRQLDADIEADLAAAMSGFDDRMTVDTKVFKENAAKPKEANSGRFMGTVLSIHGKDVFLDIPGRRHQGLLPYSAFDKPPVIGDQIEVGIEGFDSENGVLRLNKDGSAQSVDWSSVKKGQTVEARVTGTNKGGLSVEVNGIRAFLPISQIDMYRVENIEQFMNQKLICQVMEVIPSEKNLVVSRRALLEADRKRLEESFWNDIEVGQVKKGTIRSIQKFGAFVNIGAADGLLPISELMWGRVGKVEDVVKDGQQVEVKVTKVDREARRLTLSLKSMTESPWMSISERLPIGTNMKAKITRITEFGAFAEVEPGIEGLIHISEMGLPRGRRIRDRFQENKEYDVQVVSIDKEAQRMGLSVQAIEVAKQKAESDAAKSEMAAREAAEEAAEEEPKPKKVFPFKLRGGK